MNPQRGFSIIAVVFILVVLAGLGAVIAQISATQHLGSALAQAGRSGFAPTARGWLGPEAPPLPPAGAPLSAGMTGDTALSLAGRDCTRS